MDYREKVTAHLTQLLTALPVPDRESEMAECVATANGHLDSNPSQDNPTKFAADLLSDPGMIALVEQDQKGKLALSAETPSELVANLMPSDHHGE